MLKKKSKKKLFRFSENKRPRTNSPSARVPVLQDMSERPPYFVRGIKADSKEEYWCALALEKIREQTGWDWEYQVPVNGGRYIRGGNVVDFVIHTPIRWTMLDPKGRYWHTGIHEDQNQMQNVARQKNWRLIEWFTDSTPTKEATLSFLRKELGL